MLLSQMLKNISDIPGGNRMMDTCKDRLVSILDEYISDEGDHEFTEEDLDILSETFAFCFSENANETLSDCKRFISKLASGETFDENDYVDYSETQLDYEQIEEEDEDED